MKLFQQMFFGERVYKRNIKGSMKKIYRKGHQTLEHWHVFGVVSPSCRGLISD